MNTTVLMPETPVIEKALKKFEITDTAIAEMKENYMALTISGIDDKKGLKAVYEARQIVKGKRILVERKRKELNASANEYIKSVNGEAKRITELLEPIENYLEAEENRIEQEKERIKKEAEEKEQRRIQERIDKLHAYGYAVDYGAIKTITDIEFNDVLEQARIGYEKELQHKAEAERLKKEETERLQKEREELDKQRRELEYERNILAAEKRAEELKKQKEQEAKDKVERERLQAIETEKQKEQDMKRALSLRPDKDKLIDFAKILSALEYPELNDMESKTILFRTQTNIKAAIGLIEKFTNEVSVILAHYDKKARATIIS